MTRFDFDANLTLEDASAAIKAKDAAVTRVEFLDMSGTPLSNGTRIMEVAPGTTFVAVNGFSFGLSTLTPTDTAASSALVDALDADIADLPHPKMSYDAFIKLCTDRGASVPEARDVLEALEQRNRVLHFESASEPELRRTVILNPESARERIIRAMDVGGTRQTEAALEKEAALEDVRGRIADLEGRKTAADSAAYRRFRALAWAGLLGMTTQVSVLAYATWEVYSWDVMEPFTYFVGMGFAWISFAHFARVKDDAEYSNLKNWYLSRRRTSLYAANDVSLDELTALTATEAQLEREVNTLRARTQA